MHPITKFIFKLIGNIFMLSESHSIFQKLKSWKTWLENALSFHAGNFCMLLGIFPIKSFSANRIWIEFSFNYHNFFLLKKQSQYPKKIAGSLFYNTHMLLHPIDGTKECKTTEIKVFNNVEPVMLKIRLI